MFLIVHTCMAILCHEDPIYCSGPRQSRFKTKHERPTGCAKSSSLCVFVVVLVIRLKSHMMNSPPEAESKSRAAPGITSIIVING